MQDAETAIPRRPNAFFQVVLGLRQVGKTTGMRQLAERWRGPIHMVSADSIAPPDARWVDLNWRMAKSMGSGALLVIDEIQKIPEWSSTVKRLFDADRASRSLNVVLLGSASLTLQQGLAESLAGRYEIVRADHWNLSECEQAFGWDFDAFLKYGGYPGAAELVSDLERWRAYIRNSIIEPVLLKDLLSLTVINKPALFRKTFELAMSYPAQEISLQKLLGLLQESGNVSTIKYYLEIFEGAFLLRSLRKYSGSTVRKRTSSPKLLSMNNALVHALRDPSAVEGDSDWRGRVFECAVGAALCRTGDPVYYWRDGRHEVDFVVDSPKGLAAVEVKSGRERRTIGLAVFCERYPEAIPIVIDRSKGEALLRGESLADQI